MTMQNRTDPAKKPEAPLLRDFLHALKYYLGGRRMLVAAAIAIVGGGLLLNWSWLVAAGMAPLLLAVLSCAAMCALGLGVMGISARRGKGEDGAGGAGDHHSADRDDGHESDDTNRP